MSESVYHFNVWDLTFVAGMKAKREGFPETANPYLTNFHNEQQDAWERGWKAQEATDMGIELIPPKGKT